MIVVCVDHYPELSQTFVISEIEGLRRLGRHVEVEARRHAPRPNPAAPRDLKVAYWQDDGRPAKLAALLWLMARHPRRAIADLRARSRWEREEVVTPLRVLALVAWRRRKASHLHVHFAAQMALDGLRIGALIGRPVSITAHAFEIYQERTNLPEKLTRAAFSTSGCEYTVRDLQALLPEARRASVHRIIMGVDAEAFSRSTPYPGGRRVVAVGRLIEKKGFTHLLDAVAELERDAPLDRLVIIGDGPLRQGLEQQCERLGLEHRVEFAGSRSPAEIRAALEVADALAMPCVVAADGDRDSMPVVVKEALAMEIPVVASDEVGLPELVSDAWGRLAAPGDARALAAALRDLLAQPAEVRAEMGRAGRRHVQAECNIEIEAARLAALIDAAGQRSGAGTPPSGRSARAGVPATSHPSG